MSEVIDRTKDEITLSLLQVRVMASGLKMVNGKSPFEPIKAKLPKGSEFVSMTLGEVSLVNLVGRLDVVTTTGTTKVYVNFESKHAITYLQGLGNN